MTEADSVKAQALEVAQKAREANIALVQAQNAIRDMQQGILLLDLSTNSRYVRTAARFAPRLGEAISGDLEVLLTIEQDMKDLARML